MCIILLIFGIAFLRIVYEGWRDNWIPRPYVRNENEETAALIGFIFVALFLLAYGLYHLNVPEL